MRLLTPKQVKARKTERNDTLRLASNKAKEALIERTDKINTLDASYKARKASLTAKYHEEVKQYTLRLKELDNEVQTLEKRKKRALEPLQEFEQELNIRRQDLDKAKIENDVESERLETLQSALSVKTKDLDTQELDIESQMQALDKRRRGIEEDESYVKLARQDFATKLDSLQLAEVKLADKSAKLDRQNNEKQASLKAQHLNLDEKKKVLDKQEKHIASERAKLDSVVQELKAKGLWQK